MCTLIFRRESFDDLKDPINVDPWDSACGKCDDGDGEIQRRRNLPHWPYATWFPHCIMGRRINTSHRQSRNGAELSLPLPVLDYCFMRNAADKDLVTLLVRKLDPSSQTVGCALT